MQKPEQSLFLRVSAIRFDVRHSPRAMSVVGVPQKQVLLKPLLILVRFPTVREESTVYPIVRREHIVDAREDHLEG